MILIVLHLNLKKITGQTETDGTKDVQIMVSLKYLSNFWRTLKMPLILKLTFLKLGLKNVLK